MKTSVITILSTIALTLSLTSCKEDYSELIQKIEATQTELQQQDSVLVNQRNELSKRVFTATTTSQKIINPKDSLFTILVNEQNTLITRLEVIIQKNKELITKLNDDSVNPIEAEKEYTAQVDELELMKPEINSAKESYENLVKEVDEILESANDTTKAK